jgi:hypothetical protein
MAIERVAAAARSDSLTTRRAPTTLRDILGHLVVLTAAALA